MAGERAGAGEPSNELTFAGSPRKLEDDNFTATLAAAVSAAFGLLDPSFSPRACLIRRILMFIGLEDFLLSQVLLTVPRNGCLFFPNAAEDCADSVRTKQSRQLLDEFDMDRAAAAVTANNPELFLDIAAAAVSILDMLAPADAKDSTDLIPDK